MVSIYSHSRLSLLLFAISLPLIGITQTSPIHHQEESTTETAQFLARFAEARKQAGDTQVPFHEKRFLPFMDNALETTGTLAFHPPNCFRRKVDRGSLTVCDGKTLWIYHSTLQQVEIYDLNRTPFLSDTLTAMTATLAAVQLPALFQCTVRRNTNGTATLFLIPRRGALRKVISKITLVLHPDFTPSQLEINSREGDRTLTTFGEESRMRFNANTFEFRPPPGTSISRPLAK